MLDPDTSSGDTVDPFTFAVSAVADATENPLEVLFFGPQARAIRMTIFLVGTALLIAIVLVVLRVIRSRASRRLAEELPPDTGSADAALTRTAADELVGDPVRPQR